MTAQATYIDTVRSPQQTPQPIEPPPTSKNCSVCGGTSKVPCSNCGGDGYLDPGDPGY